MVRFIEMWLLLRLLEYQEWYVINHEKNTMDDEQAMLGLIVDRQYFLTYNSNNNLLWALLPKKFRTLVRPLKTNEETPPSNKVKLNYLYSLLREAHEEYKYVENALDLKVPNGSENKIKISPRGESFITYFGGLTALIRNFWEAWSLLVLTLLPYWGPKVYNYFFALKSH